MKFITFLKPVPINRKMTPLKGRMYANREYATTWNAIQMQFRSQAKSEPFTTKVSVTIYFGWSRMDIDSCTKSILDILQGIAYVNDKQVSRLTVERIDEPEIRVLVNPL